MPRAKAKRPQSLQPAGHHSNAARSYQFFQQQTLPQLARSINDEFWNLTVPQLATAEPGIWHAVVALSSYHELYLAGQDPYENPQRFAVSSYNKAIRSLLEWSQNSADGYVPIVSCVLIICIEVRAFIWHSYVYISNVVGITRKPCGAGPARKMWTWSAAERARAM